MRDVRLEQRDRSDWALSAAGVWEDAPALLAHMRDNTHHLEAAELVDWERLSAPGGRYLDLGCGAGWLTAMLSRKQHVASVVAWDSSPRLVGDHLPVTVGLLDGDIAKVEPVCGEFVPLLIDDHSIDVAVMSSAFHHSDRPRELLDELRRVLVPGGCIVLLNETPWHRLAMLTFTLRTSLAAFANLGGRRSRVRREGHLAADHALYDAQLGDRAMTLPQWRALAADSGWSIELIDTGLPPYRESFRPRGRLEPDLTHFVMRPR
jgi:ubiquinone/menaquinone biosynthesis C-methylase UbiE